MTPPASTDIKDRIIVLHNSHAMSVKEICNVLGIKKTLAYKVLRLHRHGISGAVTTHRYPSRKRKLDAIDMSFIRGRLKRSHSIYLDELRNEIAKHRGKHISITTTWRTLKRMNYSRKRVSAIARERKELRRNAFMNMMADLAPDPTMLMFTDESAKDERTQNRRHGWAQKSARCISHVHFVRGQRYSILPLLTLDGIVAHDVIEGSVTAERFLEFLREMVVSATIFDISSSSELTTI